LQILWPLVGVIFGEHWFAFFGQNQIKPMLYLLRVVPGGIAIPQMDKKFKNHTAMAIEYRQMLCFNINTNFFHQPNVALTVAAIHHALSYR
jgi:hypothetical protein